jgi:hypothetical protein
MRSTSLAVGISSSFLGRLRGAIPSNWCLASTLSVGHHK